MAPYTSHLPDSYRVCEEQTNTVASTLPNKQQNAEFHRNNPSQRRLYDGPPIAIRKPGDQLDSRMQSEIHLEALDTHTGGMPTRILLSGENHSKLNGGTVEEQRDEFAEEQDHLRELLVQEPRGHQDMFGAVPTVPADDEADMGLFFMDHGGYLDMCGHGTMGVVAAFIETNRLSAKLPIKIETPAGIVEAYPEVSDGRVTSVGLKNVHSYVVDTIDVELADDIGPERVTAHIVYAGNYFAMVDIDQVDLELDTEYTTQFIDLGLTIRETINTEHDLTDPVTGDDVSISLTEFFDGSGPVDRNIVIFADGAVDRSPCGTGTTAKMTLLYEKGELEVEESYTHESIIGTQFDGTIREVETRNGVDVTTPVIWGSAHIIGTHTFVKDSADPKPSFALYEG